MPQAADRNLLFVVLALQNDLVRRGPLLNGLAVWSRAKHRPVGDALVKAGALSADDRDVVEALIVAHDSENSGFAPAAGAGEGLAFRRIVDDMESGDLLGALADSSLETQQIDADASTLGDATENRLRGFEVVNELGRGGMGIVYRARDLALDREVAVKVLQDKYEPTSPVARRFVEEARITGQLQHPGVPAVYQVGSFADGRPYLAMKLIKGETLDALLTAEAPVDTLSVFEAICQTVGYAHARGVVHRDLKPSNVMVGAFGEVQVMDWGLAKVFVSRESKTSAQETDPDATTVPTEIRSARDAETPFTQHGSVLGTPSFMAPEQAAGDSDLIDERADVFGLGAILCVMLTGKPPFTGKDSDSVRINALRGKTEATFQRLDDCGAESGLVALCKRCLDFEPRARPADANEVAAEVATMRLAFAERLRLAEKARHEADVRETEQSKRRRVLLGSTAVVIAVLVLGIAGTSVGLFNSNVAWKAELAARELADDRVEAANEILNFVKTKIFAAARPKGQQRGLGKDVTLREALVACLPALDNEFPTRPMIEASLRESLANNFFYLGDPAMMLRQSERAYALRLTHLGPDDAMTRKGGTNLALARMELGRHNEAHALLESLLPGLRRDLGVDHPETLVVVINLSKACLASGRVDDARSLLQEALEDPLRRLPLHHPDVLIVRTNLGIACLSAKDVNRAIEIFEGVLETYRELGKLEHPDALVASLNLGNAYSAVGRHNDALDLRERTLPIMKRVLPPEHEVVLAGIENLANSFYNAGRNVEEHKLRVEVADTRSRILPPSDPLIAKSARLLSRSLMKLGRGSEAIRVIDEYIASVDGKSAEPIEVSTFLTTRLRHFQKAGDAGQCRSTAEMWERRPIATPNHLADAACLRAVAAGQYAKAKDSKEASADAELAMNWLRKALAAGYADRAHLEKDKDLDYLRSRDDFKKLLSAMKAPAVPAGSKAAQK